MAFIHRFGSSLNEHVHFHVCVVDGVFEEVAGSVIFHPASAIDAAAVVQVQATLRRRILRAFVARGLLQSCDAKEMLAYPHSGFSVDAGVCVESKDRAALERLLRYCARSPFAMERLRKEGVALVYRCAKQRSEPGPELAASGCGHGSGDTGANHHGAGRADQHGGVRAWCDMAVQPAPDYEVDQSVKW